MCPGLVVGHLVGPSEFRAVVPTPSPMGIWGHTACLQLIGATPGDGSFTGAQPLSLPLSPPCTGWGVGSTRPVMGPGCLLGAPFWGKLGAGPVSLSKVPWVQAGADTDTGQQ